MAKGPGGDFEKEVQLSFPKTTESGRPVDARKLPDPATWFGADNAGGQQGQRFSPKNPYDFRVIAEAAINLSSEWENAFPVVPVIFFAIECKRTQATIAKATGLLRSRLSFSKVADHQVSGLMKARAAGAAAGILWLSELPDKSESRCVWIPIEEFVAYRDRCKGLSKNVASLALCDVDGLAPMVRSLEVEQDVGRGISKRYWKLRELMIWYGADVEPTGAKARAKPSKTAQRPVAAPGPPKDRNQTKLGRLLASAQANRKGAA